MENGPFIGDLMIYLLKVMVIVHGYVSLPEGTTGLC